MRRLRIAIASLSFLVLAACVPFPTENPISAYKEIREISRSGGGNLDLPDVSIILNTTGDDAIDVYTDGTEDKRVSIAEAVADRLGEEVPVAVPDEFEEDVATVQLDRRLLQRRGDTWEITIERISS